MELKEAYEIFEQMRLKISRFEKSFGRDLIDEFESVNLKDADERYKRDIAIKIIKDLDDVKELMAWAIAPIEREGRLEKNNDGKYQISTIADEDYEFSAGSQIDFWNEDFDKWEMSLILHRNGDYYISGLGEDENIEGVLVRTKK